MGGGLRRDKLLCEGLYLFWDVSLTVPVLMGVALSLSCVFSCCSIYHEVYIHCCGCSSALIYLCLPCSYPFNATTSWYLEWVLMIDDLHHVPSARRWMLIWSCLLSFRCPIDVSTSLLCIFKPIYLSLVCVHACVFFTHTHYLCVLRAISFPDPQSLAIPCQMKYWWKE